MTGITTQVSQILLVGVDEKSVPRQEVGSEMDMHSIVDVRCSIFPSSSITNVYLDANHIRSLSSALLIGVKVGAECYEDSDTSGNAQSTFDCVSVTVVNGIIFYPLVRPGSLCT